jgi:hypothetical protein
MMKFVIVALSLVGTAYLLMMYAGDMWHKVAFTTGPTGNVSYAAVILAACGAFLFLKLKTK